MDKQIHYVNSLLSLSQQINFPGTGNTENPTYNCDETTSYKLASRGPFYDNAVSFHCLIYICIVLSNRNKLFIGVAIRLYLFIDTSLSAEQQNTCRASFSSTEIVADRAENCALLPKLLRMGLNPPLAQTIQS
jgi:hypothetical protein